MIVIDDPINRGIRRESRPAPEDISRSPAGETYNAPTLALPHAKKEIGARCLKHRHSRCPQVVYLSDGHWISRSRWWVRREEQIYLEYDKTHPFKGVDASILVKLDDLDNLRQQCRNAGVNIRPNMNTKRLELALRHATAIGSTPPA